MTPFGGELWNPVNLRNRVSWSAVYNAYADVLDGDYVTGSFYTYDILGNIKTLLQDYKTIVTSNQADRWKRINYDYDLVSGKVNMVSYQSGKKDAFYHRYSYDAENRITGVATSHDSVYWENDAYYQYYKHGPLARTVIGQQQVQGIDYAYNLQGWLKGVNSTALTPAYDMGGDGSMVARDAFGFALHYYGGRDYAPVNSSKTPFTAALISKPLFNGNITAISQHLQTLGAPLLSSYSYDVLNRLVGMQVSNGLNTSTNTWTPVALDDYKEAISYDANGNILTYNRNGNKAVPDKPMDRLAYTYKTGTNRLDFITDSVNAAKYDNDIDSQLSGNYAYDSIGNLVKDSAGGILEVKWTIYGKIASIKKADNTVISYAYDVAGNRISKKVNDVQTWYVRDATGNVMSIYTKGDISVNGGVLTQTEVDLYGSSRLGINTLTTNVENSATTNSNLTGLGAGININFIRGKKFFELSNHLGNVLTTVSDKKLGVSVNGSIIDYYIADIVSAQEYYPFGMQMPGREINSSTYRYGFNGKENDNEVKGEGNQLDYGMRVYDPRIGRWLSIDPLVTKYPEFTPYNFSENNPIYYVDLDGSEGNPFGIPNMAWKFGGIRQPFNDIEAKEWGVKALKIWIGAQVTVMLAVVPIEDAVIASVAGMGFKAERAFVRFRMLKNASEATKAPKIVSSADELYKILKPAEEAEAAISLPIQEAPVVNNGSHGANVLSDFKEDLPNSFKGINQEHLNAAIGDMNGKPIVNKITGKVYDHLDDISGHMRSLNGRIKELNKFINNGAFMESTLTEAVKLRTNLQKQYDSYQAALTRAANAQKLKINLKKK